MELVIELCTCMRGYVYKIFGMQLSGKSYPVNESLGMVVCTGDICCLKYDSFNRVVHLHYIRNYRAAPRPLQWP